MDSFIDMGRLAMAAKHYKDIAELYEGQSTGDDEDAKKACEFFEKAADLYRDEEQTSSANQCYLKFAQFSAELGDYKAAIGCYENVAKNSLGNNLLKYSVKDYLFNAGLCQIINTNGEQARENIDRYRDMDPTFDDQRQCKLLLDILDALDEGDLAKFTQVTKEYDTISRFDKFKLALMLKIKKKVEEGEEEDLT